MNKVVKPIGAILAAFAVYFGVQLAYTAIFSVMVIFSATTLEAMEALLLRMAMPVAAISGVVTLVLFFLYPVARRIPIKEMYRIKRIPVLAFPLLLLFGVVTSYAMNLVIQTIPFSDAMWKTYEEAVSTPLSQNNIYTILSVLVIAPLLEEILFRAITVGNLSRFMKSYIAVPISAALFALAHGNLIQMTYAFICGLLLGLLFVRYRSIVATILFHFAFNGASYLIPLIPERYIPEFLLACFFAAILLFLIMLLTTVPAAKRRKRKERKQAKKAAKKQKKQDEKAEKRQAKLDKKEAIRAEAERIAAEIEAERLAEAERKKQEKLEKKSARQMADASASSVEEVPTESDTPAEE